MHKAISINRLILIALALSLALCTSAQTYVGTISTGSYTQREVEVSLRSTPRGEATIDIKHVKFARLMPVKVDVTIPSVKVEGRTLAADDVVPTTGQKRQEKRRVRQLRGTADGEQLSFTCTMGGKPVTYRGRRQK